MDIINYILTGISCLCTIASIVGAYKSIKYYNKSKQLTIYANTNLAIVECNKIIASLIELIKAYSCNQRGVNKSKRISEIGVEIKTCINKLYEILPVDDVNKIYNILNSKDLNVDSYINSIIGKNDPSFRTCSHRKNYDII